MSSVLSVRRQKSKFVPSLCPALAVPFRAVVER
jgi:hypothetical protein